MAQPTAVLSYGETTFQLGEAPRIVRRADGFDEGQFEFIGGTENSCLPGSSIPEYSGMWCAEDSITDHSGYLEHSIRAVGLRSGSQRLVAESVVSAEDGFDTATESWIASTAASFRLGRSAAGGNQLYCVGVNAKNSPVATFQLIELQFKGIADGSRPDRYKYGTLTREMTIENAALQTAGGDGNRPHTWNIAMGAATMERSYLSNRAPNYALVGKQIGTPAGFPNTAPLPWTVPTEVVKWQWPNGVMLAAINAEQVLAKSIYFVTETYVQRDRIIV